MHLPSGSGIDAGTKIDTTVSTGEKLVFGTAFHHMNEHGFYTTWTQHRITVVGSLLSSIDIPIGGRNKNEIKDYLHEVFYNTLIGEVEEWPL